MSALCDERQFRGGERATKCYFQQVALESLLALLVELSWPVWMTVNDWQSES